MKITLLLEFPGRTRPLVLAAVGAMLRALPNSAKLEIAESRKTVLFGGDSLDDHVAEDALTPLELAILATQENAV